jgi:hypothetical protein
MDYAMAATVRRCAKAAANVWVHDISDGPQLELGRDDIASAGRGVIAAVGGGGEAGLDKHADDAEGEEAHGGGL